MHWLPTRIALAATLGALAMAPTHDALAADATAKADEGLPNPALYLGLYGGYNLVFNGWDLDEDADAGVSPHSSPILGLRLGFQVNPHLALELGAGFIPYSGDADAEGLAIVYRGDVLIHPFTGDWSPYLGLGAGLYQGASGDFGDDADWEIHYGIGLRGMLTRWLALRIEVRHNMTDSYEDGLAHLIEITGGFDFFVWSASSGPPPDTDRDGVPDAEDACRTVAGARTARGCPDADQDGITDNDDKCPNLPGPKINAGCPDTDGDGLADDLDRCPDQAGPTASDGCPPPPPDSDGDGLLDPDDACPEEAGPKDTLGCPDRDGDGILDRDDACPDTPGVVSEKGCLPQVIQSKFSGAIQGIYFGSGSARIKPRSFKVLDEAADLLAEYGNLRIEISGHTDNQGRDDRNLTLSQARADAVRQYLIDKGISGDRLVAVGYGETKPVASNNTGRGRAKNRRIEFKMLPN